ncbi:MAG: hypothetical protein Q9167_005632 [Letrouitia subvulpina]
MRFLLLNKVVLVLQSLLEVYHVYGAAAGGRTVGLQSAVGERGENQRVFLPDEPPSPFTGHGIITRDDFLELAKSLYLDPLPDDPDVYQHYLNTSYRVYYYGKIGLVGDVAQVNIAIPWINKCRPRIRGVKDLWPRLVCTTETCSLEVTFAVTRDYQATEGFRIETTLGAGVEAKGVSASMSTTTGREWTKTWSFGGSSSVTYTWNLNQGEQCVPSMANVELECEADFDTVYYDTYWRSINGDMWLEWRYNRQTGPYANGQWCRDLAVEDRPLRNESIWHPVIPGDENRGMILSLPGSFINQFRQNQGDFLVRDDQVVIRKLERTPGGWRDIFVCDRNPRERRRETVTVPLSSASGVLQGVIGCIN